MILSLSGVLTFGHAGPTTAKRSSSFESLVAQARKAQVDERYADAARLYGRAVVLAEDQADSTHAAQSLIALSGAQIRLFQYKAALESAHKGRALAIQVQSVTLEGAACTDLSAIYSALGDPAQASEKAHEAVECLRKASNLDYLGRALLNEAIADSDADPTVNERAYREAIADFHTARDAHFEARAWDALGTSFLLTDRFSQARDALHQAFVLENDNHDQDALALTLEHLSELDFRTGHLNTALDEVDLAFRSPSASFRMTPQYYPLHVRGQILEGLGRKQDALEQYRKAMISADAWRQGALPGDMTNTQTVVLLHEIYANFAELAAELSLARDDPKLAREGFEAIAANRAASLREQITLAFGRNQRLPPRYYELLGQLQATEAQADLGSGADAKSLELRKIRLSLGEIENQIGLSTRNIPESNERNGHKNSLGDIQARLTSEQVLLSFATGSRRSFLWAITKDQMHVYKLANQDEIRHEAVAFTEAAHTGATSFRSSAERLSVLLLGSLPASIRAKREWLIAGDGPLLDAVPFSALPESPASPNPLIAAHSLRLLPSEMLLANQTPQPPNSLFLGVGDPIYNLADPRRQPALVNTAATRDSASLALARLPGSGQEIRSSASASGIARTRLLVGPQANAAGLNEAIKDGPEVIHFAVHVISPSGRPQDAALALSLNQRNIPELLTPEMVAQYRLPGSLVVLSGCASEQGRSLPGAGLMGLSRAWLLAGAAAVVVTAWPTPDDSGKFFSAFYAHLSAEKQGTLSKRAAAALQQAQLEMRQSGGYRSKPSLWAAYSIITKE
jgi:CHAT domain-containing protein/predicted negative regulator of RcsB-dependent stress response